jgi:hypothetical protein
MTKYVGGYDPRKIGSGGMYGGARRAAPSKPGNQLGKAIGSQSLSDRNRGSVFQPYGSGSSTFRFSDPNLPGYYYGSDNSGPTPTTPPGGLPPLPRPGPGGGRGGGGGGGGGGAAKPDYSGIIDLMNRKTPEQMKWEDLPFNPYNAPEFYKFDDAIYGKARQGLTDAVAADRTAGAASYAQGHQELAQYRDPFSGQHTTDPGRSAAMRRMLEAQGTPLGQNADEEGRGVQADQAFGNLLNILSAVSGQSQDSRVRALRGDERAFGERLDAEHRGGTLMVDMTEAKARSQYDKDKWEFGEAVARKNYDANMAVAQYNNTGRNQVSQGNTQQNNAFNMSNLQAILQMLASGGTGVSPATYTGV